MVVKQTKGGPKRYTWMSGLVGSILCPVPVPLSGQGQGQTGLTGWVCTCVYWQGRRQTAGRRHRAGVAGGERRGRLGFEGGAWFGTVIPVVVGTGNRGLVGAGSRRVPQLWHQHLDSNKSKCSTGLRTMHGVDDDDDTRRHTKRRPRCWGCTAEGDWATWGGVGGRGGRRRRLRLWRRLGDLQ